jgi:type IV secretion system protein TrbL
MILSALIYIAFPLSSIAAGIPQNNGLDQIIDKYHNSISTWEPIIYNLTLSLFWGLVLISFTWAMIQLVIKEGTGLVDVVAELTRRTLTIGFSIWMMQEAPNLARTLIKSFIHVGSEISDGKVKFSPSNALDLGIQIISIAWKQTSLWSPALSIVLMISALIIVCCFAVIALDMCVVIISGYIIVSGGIIAMGFLGSEWTRENAMNYFTAVLGIAFKMFVMQLIFFIGYSFVSEWGESINAQSETIDYLIILATTIVFAGLMREIPSIASSLASGRFTMQGGGIAAAGMGVAAAAAGATLLAMGGTQAAMNMFKGGGGDSPSPSQPQSATMDTGNGDDGKGFAEKMQSQPSSTPSESADSSSTSSSASQPSPSGSGSESSPASAEKSVSSDSNNADSADKQKDSKIKGAAKTAGGMMKSTLETVANQSKFGQLLADGAKKLGEDPVDPATASAEDIRRQLEASIDHPSAFNPTPDGEDTTEEAPSRFSDNITPADNPYVQEEENKRDSADDTGEQS